jgi:hypothetical protein
MEEPDLIDARSPGWFWASNHIVRGGQKASVWAIATYVCLASYANQARTAWPGARTVASTLGCTERQTRRTIKELIDLGWVTVVPRYRKDGSQTSNAYVLNEIGVNTTPQTAPKPETDGRNAQSGGGRLPSHPNEVDLLEQEVHRDYAQNAAEPAIRAQSHLIGINESGKAFERTQGDLEQIRKEAKPTYRIPEAIVDALDKVPLLAKDQTLREPSWWQAQHRAYQGVDFAAELYRMGAWVVSNPGKRPKKQLRRFLSNWFSRAYERMEEGRS